ARHRRRSFGPLGPLTCLLRSAALFQPIGQPQLDERLTCHPEAPRLPVNGSHHPRWKINIDAFGLQTGASRFAEIELIRDALASVELPLKCRRLRLPFHGFPLHRSPPLPLATASRRSIECSRLDESSRQTNAYLRSCRLRPNAARR